MNKVYYKFSDGTRVETLKEALELKQSKNERYVVGYEFMPVPASKDLDGTFNKDGSKFRTPVGLRTSK